MTLVLTPSEIVSKLEKNGELGLLGKAPRWNRRLLGELINVQNGAPFSSDKFNREGLGMPLIRIRDVGASETSTYFDGEYDPAYVVRAGDLLVGMDGDFRCAKWTSGDALLNQRVCRLKVISAELDERFLFLILQGYLDAIWKETSATTVKHLSSKSIQQIPIPLPSMKEQRKIVELLEDHLSRLDAALADVKQAKFKAAQFRRSLLQSAFTGNLNGGGTRPMTVWKTEKLSNLLAVSIGGIWGEEAGIAEIDVSVVRVTELKAHGRIDPSSAVTRSVTLKQLASRELQDGDLLLEKSGGGPNSPVGRVGYFFQEGKRTVCSNFMQLMRPDSTKVLPKYLFYFLDGFHSTGGTIPMQTATTNIRNIKTPQYMDIDVPVPPLPEQQKIVEILEDHLSRLDASVAIADAMEKQSSSLRRSLLQAAFTGQLTKEVASV